MGCGHASNAGGCDGNDFEHDGQRWYHQSTPTGPSPNLRQHQHQPFNAFQPIHQHKHLNSFHPIHPNKTHKVAAERDEHDVSKGLAERIRTACEASLGQQLSHPNVIATYRYHVQGGASPKSGPGSPRQSVTSIALSPARPQRQHAEQLGSPTSSGAAVFSVPEPSTPSATRAAAVVRQQKARSAARAMGFGGGNSISSLGSGGSGATSNGMAETWIVLELAPRGTLQQAIDGAIDGVFRLPGPTDGVNMPAVLDAAAQVAAGMAYLHSQDVVHGDLAPKNILLADQPAAAQEAGGQPDNSGGAFPFVIKVRRACSCAELSCGWVPPGRGEESVC